RHLKPDGVLAVHISNRYLDLAPVCQRAAGQVHRPVMLLHGSAQTFSDPSDWVLITADEGFWGDPIFSGASLVAVTAPPAFRGWTDQYSSLWAVLNARRGSTRN
ncbi:MAG TPA: hypothetical protein VKB34_16095, partial [Povalibacter sp.]|nr:hypothetical protein [Povalibacter sp.]